MKRVKMVFYCVSISLLLMYGIDQLSVLYDNKANNTNLEVVKFNRDMVETKQYNNTYMINDLTQEEQKKLLEEARIREEEKHRKWINIIASAYTASADECGNSLGITASGTKVSVERGTIAVPSDINFGTKIVIPELGRIFIAEDRGNPQYIGRIDGDTIRIDIYMRTKEEAIAFGVRKFRGYIIVE